MENYGNFSWQFFVYPCFIFVALILIIYVAYALQLRKKSLKDLMDEGFIEDKKIHLQITARKKMKLNGGQIAGILIVVGSIGLIVYQATRSESTVTFYTPAEVYANPIKFESKLFRVSGLVMAGTKEWDAKNSDLKFKMTDLEGHNFIVHYKGIPPDLFKEGQGVVVEGRLLDSNPTQAQNEKTIQANLLMVKHSEVYDTKVDHKQLKEVKLLDSITKDQYQTSQK